MLPCQRATFSVISYALLNESYMKELSRKTKKCGSNFVVCRALEYQ